MKKKLTKSIAIILAVMMLFAVMPLNALAYYKEKADSISFKDKSGNIIFTDSSWETKFPYGTFAFDTSELTVTEGGEGKITVYRLGGTKGRATAHLAYVPAVTDIAEGVKSYTNAAGSSDISIRVEDPLPIAKYQPLGKDPDPLKPSPEVGIIVGDADAQGDVHLTVNTEADVYQWYILTDGEWKKVSDATTKEFIIAEKDYPDYDVCCVYTKEGVAYCSDSAKGVAYVYPQQEVLDTPLSDIDLNTPTTYSVLPMNDPDKYSGYAFTVTFAENEWVKDIYVNANDNDKSEPDKFGMFTITGCEGGSLYDTANTLMFHIKDNEAPTPCQIGFTVTDVTADKALGTAELTVKRTGGNQNVLSVDYSTKDGTAVAGRDYSAVSGTLNFYSDVDEQTVKIPLINNGIATDDKVSLSVSLSNLKGDTDKICTLTDTTATVHLYNTASGENKNLATMLYDNGAVDISEKTPEASESVAPTKLGTVGGTEIKRKGESPDATIVYPDLNGKNGEISAFTYDYPVGTVKFTNPGNPWKDRTLIANKGGWTGDTLSGLYGTGWTGGSADGAGWKLESKGNASVDLTIPYGSAMYSDFYGNFSWNASLASDSDLFWYGLEYVYPYFQILKSNGEQFAYTNDNHSTSGSWSKGYRLTWYTSGTLSKSWNVSDDIGKLRLGTQIHDAHNGKNNALAGLNSAYLTRRKLNNNLGLRIFTANDSDSSPSGCTKLTIASGVYDSIQPAISIVDKQGGVDYNGKLYVGSTIQVDLKSTPSYKPATEDSKLNYAVYLTDSNGKIVATGIKEANSNIYDLKMIWNGFTQASLTDTYTINIVMTRSQELQLDLKPSVQRMKDADGNVLDSIDTSRIDDAVDAFKSSGTKSYITIGYSETDKNSNNRFTYKTMNINKSDLIGSDTEGVLKYPSNIENLQWINFNMPAEDIIILDGKSYYGNENIYLEMKNLSTATLEFRYYNKDYIAARNSMITSIAQTGLYLDANGNGRIDGYYNRQTGYFVLEKDANGQDIDQLIYFLNPNTDYDESVFAPIPLYDSKGQIVGYRQYFMKTFYTMTPRCLVTPAGTNENDSAQVMPAFIADVTNPNTIATLTDEQKAYRYIVSGKSRSYDNNSVTQSESDYAFSADNHLMYGAGASAVSTVDIPLGGDYNPPKIESGSFTWKPDYHGNLLYNFTSPSDVFIPHSLAGDNIPVAEITGIDPDTGAVTYKDGDSAAAAKINNYLGSFTGNDTFALCVQEQNSTGTGSMPVPETISHSTSGTYPNSDYLKSQKGASTPDTGVDMAQSGNDFPEFNLDMGTKLPVADIGVTDYVTVTMDGYEVGFSIGIPLGGYNSNGDAGVAGIGPGGGSGGSGGSGSSSGSSNWFGPKKANAAKVKDMGLLKDFLKKPGMESAKNADDSYSSAKDKGQMKSSAFKVDFSVSLAFLFKYNPIDNAYRFSQFSAAIAAAMEYKMQYRLTPCPIVYVYVTVGISLEIGTGLTVDRDPKEEPTAVLNTEKILKAGEIYTFDTDYKAFNVTFSGKLGLKSTVPGFKEGYIKSDGDDPVTVTMKQQDGNKLSQNQTVTLVALEDTTLKRVGRIVDADSDVYWNGMTISPSAFVEAGAGIGIEIMKFEVFIKISVGCKMTLGSYNKEYDTKTGLYSGSYDGFSFDEFDFSLGLGFRVVFLLFSYEMNLIKYSITYDKEDGWKQKWSALGDKFGGDIGSLSMTDGSGNTTSTPVRIRLPGSTQDTQKIYQPERDGELSAYSYNPSDKNVPFQLSGYGSSGDAFKLADGLLTGYDYKVVTVGKDNYVIYTYGRKGAANEVDNSMLAMSKLRVTSVNGKESYGLVNPVDELSTTPYILVDTTDGTKDDGTGDLDFNVWTDGDTIHAAWISYASVSAAAPTVLAKPASSIPQLNDGTEMDLTNYRNTGFVPAAPAVVADPGTKPAQPVQSDYYVSETDYASAYSSYEEAKNAYDAALDDYNGYDAEKKNYDNYLEAKKAYDEALNIYNEWYAYYASVDDYNAYIQSRATNAAKNTVVKKASFTVKTTYDGTEGFTPAQTVSGATGATVYVPDSSRDGSVVFYAQAILDNAWKTQQVSDYTSYLNSAYPGGDASKSIRDYRLLYQTGIWETYGKGTKLCANVNGKISSINLASGQVLDNIETEKTGSGDYCIAYTTSQKSYQSGDLVTTRRLYIRSSKVNTDNTVTFGTPYLIRTLVDYDQNKGGKDGVYSNTSLTRTYSDPYFANFQFLNGKLGQLTGGESVKLLSADTPEDFLLFEMNGSTYIIPESQVSSILTSGTGTLYPFFTPANMTGTDGKPAQQSTTGRSEVTIGADGAGNISAVYTGAVANTQNNAVYLSKYDPNTNTWGVGIMLTMHNMQVYEDGISNGWTNDEYEKAYLGQLSGYTGGSMDMLKFSNLQIALGLTTAPSSAGSISTLSENGTVSMSTSSEYNTLAEKYGMTKEPSELSLLSSGDVREMAASDVPSAARDTLLVLTQASLTKLTQAQINGENILGPDGDSTVGIYAISYGVGGQSIGEDSVKFALYDFTAGSELRTTINFTNTGDVSIRGSDANPITVNLNVRTPDNVTTELNTWQITQNVASGQKVELSGISTPLTRDLPAGSVFFITVTEDKSYAASAFNASTLSSDGKNGTLVVSQKPELGFENFSIRNESIDSNGNAVLQVDFQVGNRGNKTADNAYVQFSYETGKDKNGKLTYAPVDLSLPGTKLTVSKEQDLVLFGASTDTDKQNGILYLYNSEDGGNISTGKGRTVSGTLVVPASYYKGGATGSLDLNVEIFSDADTVKSSQAGVISVEHGEYNGKNNVFSTQIEHATFFGTANRITLAMGNTMYLPVTIDTTRGEEPVVTVDELSDAAGGTRNLGILYYKDNENFSKGHSTGMLVITPTREGTGVIHLKDIATNTTRAITYTVTEFGEGINIFSDNNIFSFKNADGKPYDENSADAQSWKFKGNIPTWGTGETENPPYLSNLSYGDKNASFTFTTIAESIDLYFNGEVTVQSTFPGFKPVDLTSSGGSTNASVSFGSNPTNYAHTVTVTVKSESAQFDKLVEHYSNGQVPVPADDENAPHIYWNRSFPQTASMKNGSAAVNLTCYVIDDSELSSLTVNGSIPSGLVKNDNGFWQFSLPVAENGTITVAAADGSGNRTTRTVTVDWFNSTVTYGAIADAPSLKAKFQVGSEDMNGSRYVRQGETAYLSVDAAPGTVNLSPVSDITARFIGAETDPVLNKTSLEISDLSAESDGRFQVSQNGYYQVIAASADGTWRSVFLLMSRMDTAQPEVHISEADLSNQGTARELSWSVFKGDESLSAIKTATINSYPLTFQSGLTRIEGALPITFGGKYTLYAQDEAGNFNSSAVTVSDFKIDISSAGIFKVENSWNKKKDNGIIRIDSNYIAGGLYDSSKSTPAGNIYHGSYQYAVVAAAKDFSFDAAAATAQDKADYTAWLDNLVWQDNSVISGLEPGDYTVYIRDAQDTGNITVIAKKTLSVGDDYITFITSSRRASSFSAKNGAFTVSANGGKDATGLYQFAILPITGYNAGLTPISEMADKGATWQIADIPLNALNVKTFCLLKTGSYQIAIRSMAGVTISEIRTLVSDYNDIMSAEGRVRNANEGKSVKCLNEAANNYISSIDTTLQNWNNAAAGDRTAAEAAYKTVIDNDVTVLEKLQLWNDAKAAAQNGTGSQDAVRKAKDDYNNAVKAFALNKATVDADNEIAAANDALTQSKQIFSDAEKQLNAQADAAYAADPTLWDNAATSMESIGYRSGSKNTSTVEEQDPIPGYMPSFNYDADGKTVIVTLPDSITSIDTETTTRIISDNSSKDIVVIGKGLLVQIPKGTMSSGDDLQSMILLNQQIPDVPGSYAVAYTGNDGKVNIIPWSEVTSDTILYVASVPGKYSIVKNDLLFGDVPSDFWGADAVSFNVSHGLFKGTGSNNFMPNAPMTRGMFVTALGRLAGIDASKYTSAAYGDVSPDAWYGPYVKWASENGIVKGYSNNKFGPDDLITREQICTILSRFMKKMGITLSAKEAAQTFTDSSRISSWANEEVNLCQQAGLIQGKEDNRFDPQGNASRTEVAAIFMRLVDSQLYKWK